MWNYLECVRPGGTLLCLRELWRAHPCFLFYCFHQYKSANVLLPSYSGLFSVSALVTIMFCVRPKMWHCIVQLDVYSGRTLQQEEAALPPRWGSRWGLKGGSPMSWFPTSNHSPADATSTSKTPFIAIHFEAFSSIFVFRNSLKMDEFNLLLKGTPSSSKQGHKQKFLDGLASLDHLIWKLSPPKLSVF